jgi:transcriptional repressor of cell division inhibition gene dicB
MLIETARKHFGSKAKLAKALGISKQAVSTWSGPLVPEGRAYQIESITRRALRVNPDLYQKSTEPSRAGISALSG